MLHFFKSRLDKKELTKRLVFASLKQPKDQSAERSVFDEPEVKQDKLTPNDYSEDLQKWLDTLNTQSQLGWKLPSKWFQPDTSKGETVESKVDQIYATIFSDNGPLKAQLAAFNKKYHSGSPVSAEEMVFGSRATNNPERSVRLKIISEQIQNLRKLKEKQKEKLTAGNIQKNLEEGVGNVWESFQDNLSEGKYVQAGLQAAGMFLLLHAAWKLIQGKPADKDWASYLGTVVLKSAVGIALLAPSATKGKADILNTLKLTSAADSMGDRGFGRLMKNMDWRARTQAETLNALAGTDIGEIHRAYEEALAEGKSEIDPRKLLGEKAPKKNIVNGKDLFNIVEATLQRYGAKYFEAVKKRPPSESNPQEIQDGITLFIRFHKRTSNQSKSFTNVVAIEENSFVDWKNPPAVQGKINILLGMTEGLASMIVSPTKAPEKLKELFYGWLDLFEIDRAWFDSCVKDPVKEKIKELYKNNKPLAKEYMGQIKNFFKNEYVKLQRQGAETYITDVSERSLNLTIKLGGAAIDATMEMGGAIKGIVFRVGDRVWTRVANYANTPGTFGNDLIFNPWLPYKYNPHTKPPTWERVSLAKLSSEVKTFVVDGIEYSTSGSGEMIEGGAQKLSIFMQEFPARWEANIKPKLKNYGAEIAENYKLFERFAESVIQENIKPTGEYVRDAFTDDDLLFQTFCRAAAAFIASSNRDFVKRFENGSVSLTEFLDQYAKEKNNNEKYIAEFDKLITDPSAERNHFASVSDAEVEQFVAAKVREFKRSASGTPTAAEIQRIRDAAKIEARTKLQQPVERLKSLEPKVRAWVFNELGWWDLDMSVDQAEFDPNGKFIEYKGIDLKSPGKLNQMPLMGNKYNLRVHFSPDGRLGIGRTRFELISKSGIPFDFNAEDFVIAKRLKEEGIADMERVHLLQGKRLARILKMAEKLEKTLEEISSLTKENNKLIGEVKALVNKAGKSESDYAVRFANPIYANIFEVRSESTASIPKNNPTELEKYLKKVQEQNKDLKSLKKELGGSIAERAAETARQAVTEQVRREAEKKAQEVLGSGGLPAPKPKTTDGKRVPRDR
ncbi:MAG: hypothetical protein V1936_01285 [Patescibacteria group bacterium]